ncbi:MAG: OmpA family protein [Alphaproteobacteria bacterium]
MRQKSGLLLIGLCLLTLAGCSSNEEAVEVTKPQAGKTRIDLTTGQPVRVMDGDFGQPSPIRTVSNGSVQIFSLDDPAPDLRGASLPAPRYENTSVIGNQSVQITPIGQPRLMTRAQNSYSAPVKKNARPAAPLTPLQQAGNTESIYFGHNSVALSAEDMQKIQAFAREFRNLQGAVVSVEGHASLQADASDPIDRKQINLDISLERAEAVSDALLALGVPGHAIRTVGWGEEMAQQNNVAQGNARTARRVDLIVLREN